MKRLNFFQKYALKYTDKPAYKSYKEVLEDYKRRHVFEEFSKLPVKIVQKDFYNFKHSGNIGDIIYSLPAMLGLADSAKFNLYMKLNRPNNFGKYMSHPLGDVMLSMKMVEMIRPLLQYQPYFQDCIVYEDQPIDYDLDVFRDSPIMLDRSNGARWYMLIYPTAFDLNKVWIEAPKQTGLEDAIVLARSSRYHTPGINYKFLNKYSKIFFVGVEEEYKVMHELIPHLKYLPVTNFLELAGYIAGAKLFIGNQSFPFALAEAMKVNRLIELCYKYPTVNVYGDNGFDFLFQPQFEYLVKKRYEDL